MPTLRLDRLATRGLFHPLARMRNGQRGARVPILMYHSVAESSGPVRHPYYDINTTPQLFAQQMCWLRQQGYRSVSLAQALRLIHEGRRADKAVVITFDDGYRDFLTTAYPILAENEFTATVFLVAGRTGKELNGRACLSWDEARRLHAQGVEFGSHTATHPELKRLEWAEVEREVSESQDAIEQELGAPVRAFSYPYAFPETNREFTRRLRELLVKCGYDHGVSTILGTAGSESDPYFLPRLPVNSGDDPALLQAKLEGGYDWLHSLQYWLKMAKAQFSFQRS
ncbi:MAG TPA: polysaccharide deacetylase family protein [Terriglobia bacterium]|nr:polysaccharide deacetylase family protein [Terriglobia bacterium]